MSGELLLCHDGCETDTGKTKRFMTQRTLILHYAKCHFNDAGKDYGFKLAKYCLGDKYDPRAPKHYCDACLRNFNKVKEFKRDDSDKLFYHYCDQHFNDEQYHACYEILKENWVDIVPKSGDISFASSRHSSRASSFGSNAEGEFRFAQDQREMEEFRARFPELNPNIMQYNEYKNLVQSWGQANADRFYRQLEQDAEAKKLEETLKFNELAKQRNETLQNTVFELGEAVHTQAGVLHQNAQTITNLTPEQQQIQQMQANMTAMMQMMQQMMQAQANNANVNAGAHVNVRAVPVAPANDAPLAGNPMQAQANNADVNANADVTAGAMPVANDAPLAGNPNVKVGQNRPKRN
eukprot:gene9124-9892_t